jgi:hypothetical protein
MSYLNRLLESYGFVQVLIEEMVDVFSTAQDELLDGKQEDHNAQDPSVVLTQAINHVSDTLRSHWSDVLTFWHDEELSACKDCERTIVRMFACIENIQSIIKSGDLSIENMRAAMDAVYGVQGLWFEKYEDYFGCWASASSEGTPLTEEAFVFDEEAMDEAFIRMVQNALIAERLFFSLGRNKSHSAVSLRDRFFNNRRTTGRTETLDLTQHSGRSIIAADIASVAQSSNQDDLSLMTTIDAIAQYTGWHRTKKINWNRQAIVRGKGPARGGEIDLEINYQFKPVPGQIGNILVNGVGEYGVGENGGRTLNVLEIFNRLTGGDSEKERRLAQLLIQYKGGDGRALNEQSLLDAELDLPQSIPKRRLLINQFQRAAYLVCFLEVIRRNNQGYRTSAAAAEPQKVIELPFGFAVACILKLIKDGYLKLADAFSPDSLYGVFTGKGVMNENITRTINRFSELFSLFVKQYAHQIEAVSDYDVAAKGPVFCDDFQVAFTPEYLHQMLRETDGGEDESDNEDYNKLHEQEPVEPDVEGLREHLIHADLRPLKLHP